MNRRLLLKLVVAAFASLPLALPAAAAEKVTVFAAASLKNALDAATSKQGEQAKVLVRVMPGVPKAKVRSRILLTPQHAKRLMRALADNIGKFEQVHGPIRDTEMPEIPMNFGGPAAQA